MMPNQSNEVVVITKNTASLILGIISLVIGVLAIGVGWVPLLGLLAMPIAIVGFFIAGIGALIALFKRFKGIKMPFLGAIICVIGFILPILSTGGTLTKVANEMSQAMSTSGTSVALTKTADEAPHTPSTGGTSVALTKVADEVSQSMDKAREHLSVLAGRITGPEMESAEIEVVKAFIDAINSQDIASLGKLMTEDHTFLDGTTTGIPAGRNTILSGWRQYYEMFPDYAVNVESMHQDGSIVAVFGSTSGTYSGKDGMKPENKVSGPAAWKVTVEDGKVKTWKVYAEYTDTWKVIQANQG